MSRIKVQILFDRIAMGFSVVCAVHCAIMPLALAILPVLASFPVGDEVFHRLMLYLILPSSGIAVFLGCRRHKDKIVFVTALTGLAILVLSALFGHEILGEVGERISTLLGALILSIGHLRNYLLCRRDDCEHSS